jgi:hypothetical protein
MTSILDVALAAWEGAADYESAVKVLKKRVRADPDLYRQLTASSVDSLCRELIRSIIMPGVVIRILQERDPT